VRARAQHGRGKDRIRRRFLQCVSRDATYQGRQRHPFDDQNAEFILSALETMTNVIG
jgi:hypothetical protein